MENRSIVENDISEMEKMIEEGKMKEMLDMFVKLKKKGMSINNASSFNLFILLFNSIVF